MDKLKWDEALLQKSLDKDLNKKKQTMHNLKKSDIVKTQSNERLMSIKQFKVSRQKFNKAVLDYFLSDDPPDETNAFIAICQWEENGLIKTEEFKPEELVFVRSTK